MFLFQDGRFEVEGTKDHDDRVGTCHEAEGAGKAHRAGELLHEGSCNESGKTKAHDDKTCCKTAVVGKIFHQG